MSEYKWLDLVDSGAIGKILLPEINKYLDKFSLSRQGKKRDKIRRIVAHVYENQEGFQKRQEVTVQMSDSENSYSSESEDEARTIETTATGESDENSDTAQSTAISQPSILTTRTSSGRAVRRRQMTDFYLY